MAKYDKWLTEEGLIKIQGYARDGMVDRELAKAMGISRTTLTKWKKKFPEIEKALKENKEIADRKVENALFDKCQGKIVTLKKPIKVKKTKYDPKTGKKIEEKEEIVYTDTEEYVPPDTKAMTFWLMNRKPEQWKQRVEIKAENNEDEISVIQIESQQGERDIIDGVYNEIEIEE